MSERSGLIVKGHGAFETALLRGWDVSIEVQAYKSQAGEARDLLATVCLNWPVNSDSWEMLRCMLRSFCTCPSVSAHYEPTGCAYAVQFI